MIPTNNVLCLDNLAGGSRSVIPESVTNRRREKRARRLRSSGIGCPLNGVATSYRSLAVRYRYGNRLRGEDLEDRSLLSIWFVDDSAASGGDGLAWGTAYDNLQSALTASGAGDEIWVASGTYTPTNGADRAISFNLKTDVGLYGGFVGVETARSERNWQTNVTTLSGDIGTLGDDTDNSYHVVYASGVAGATLDGFTVTAGNANGSSGSVHENGGGMYATSSTTTLTNVVFNTNSAQYTGGGLCNSGESTVTLTDVVFSGNSSQVEGGGLYNYEESIATLTNVAFSENSAQYNGGGLYNYYGSVVTLTNVLFSANSAEDDGGGLLNYNSATATLTNVDFSGNTAGYRGGGIFNYDDATATLTNVNFSGNTAVGTGGGLYNFFATATLTNVDFSDNSAGDSGGGLWNVSSATATLNNVVFSGNSAFYNGGGLYNNSTATLTNVVFSGNSAHTGGGLLNWGNATLTNVVFRNNSGNGYNGGGLYNAATATLTNVVFSGNSAHIGGGGLYNNSTATLTNVVFSGNSATNDGGGLYNEGNATLTNAILWGNTASRGPQVQTGRGQTTISYSIVQGGWAGTGTGNLAADPLFVDAANGDLHLLPGSPGIDTGTATGAPAFDLDGVARPQDGDNNGSALVDRGAHEHIIGLAAAWVNDDWIEEQNVLGGSVGVLDSGDLVGDGAAVTGKVYGTEAFATILEGIAVVGSSGTVNVLTGTYGESVATNSKPVILAADGTVTLNGSLTLNLGDTMAFDIQGPTAGAEYDQWVISGPVALGNALLKVAIDPAYTPSLGDLFTLIDGADPNAILGTFLGRPDRSTATIGGHDFWQDYNDVLYGDGYDFTLLRDLPAVPSIAPLSYILEGDGVTLDGSATTDPDPGDVLTYQWMVNGNPAGTGAVLALSWSELVALGVNDGSSGYPGTGYSVTLTVTDAAGLSSTSSTTLRVENGSPTVTVVGEIPAFALEGTTSITLTALVTDPSPVDTFTYNWIVERFVQGEWQTFATGTDPSLTFAPDDNGDYRVALDVLDKDGDHAYPSLFSTFLVTNVLPTVAVSGAPTVMEGSPYTLTLGSVADPGEDAVYLYRVFWGDGTIETFAGSPPAAPTHTYVDGPGRYSIFVDVTDEDGTFAAALRSVTVTKLNAPPTDISLSNTTIDENAPAGSLVGTFSTTDPDVGDTHVYSLVAGTGDTDNAAFTISGNELRIKAVPDFETQTSYSILVSSTDQDGDAGEAPVMFTITVGNRAPSAPTDADSNPNATTEGAANGSLVGVTALATDPAGGAVTFTLTDDAGGRFAINSTTGVVSVANGALLAGPAVHAITVQASDGLAVAASTFSVTVTNNGPMVTGAGAGFEPRVHVYDAATGRLVRDFLAYDPRFTGGVYVATGDVNGDLVADIVTGAGAGGGPHVRVFDGATGNVLREFFAYDPRFTGGVYVAVGDVDRDGLADIVTGAGAGGGPHVRVFSGAVHHLLGEYYAYNSVFGGGVSVAVGDVNGDGAGDVITGAGPGGGPHVRAFRGATSDVLQEFFAYESRFTGGVYVAAGNINGDNQADILTGAGAGGGPHVRVFSGADQSELHSFFAYSGGFLGARVAASDLDGDGLDDIITGAGDSPRHGRDEGPPGHGPLVRAFSGIDLALLANFVAYDAAGTEVGVFVAGVPRAPVGGPLRLAGELSQAVGIQAPLAREMLEPILAAASSRWEFARASAAELRDLRIDVANLPGDLLGLARGRQVLIDSDAGGLGWFVDPTPEDDGEFVRLNVPSRAAAAIGRVDLLTVVLHEIGHILGRDHDEAGDGFDGLMQEELLPGMRRLPTNDVLDNYFAKL